MISRIGTQLYLGLNGLPQPPSIRLPVAKISPPPANCGGCSAGLLRLKQELT